MKFDKLLKCKYCGRDMTEDDIDHDYRGRVIAVYNICDCGASCIQENNNGFIIKHWYKEEENGIL